jgi:serine/threonine protein kinase
MSNGSPKIADFGFAISKHVSQANNQVYEFNVGTPLYMSPETLMKNHYSAKTDIWALGIVFYEMIYGTNIINFSLLRNLTFLLPD